MDFKKILFIASLWCVVPNCLYAEEVRDTSNLSKVTFAYDAGVEVTSTYLWRGIHLGGLAVQPTVMVGYDGEVTSFRGGVWATVGASDWQFKESTTPIDPEDPESAMDAYKGTYFVPELDVQIAFTFWGASIGFTHMYYFNNANTGEYSPYFCWETAQRLEQKGGSSTTELNLGLDLGWWLPQAPVYVHWNTVLRGCDPHYNRYGQVDRHAYSTYFEIGYKQTWDPYALTLDVGIGFSPWTSAIYYNNGFAVQSIYTRLDKEWEVGPCTIDLFAIGMLSPGNANDPITKDNVVVIAAGEDKLYQRLNGAIGLGFWF